MKYLVLIAAALLCGPALADDNQPQEFYKAQISKEWVVFGNIYPDNKSHHNMCTASYYWDDGSIWQINKDLDDNTLYIWTKFINWDIADPTGTSKTFRVNAYDKRGHFEAGSDLQFISVDKNTVFSLELNAEPFMRAFVAANSMRFIAPGSMQNFIVPIGHLGLTILDKMALCIKASNRQKPKSSDTGDQTVSSFPDLNSPIASADQSDQSKQDDHKTDGHYTPEDARRVANTASALGLTLPTFTIGNIKPDLPMPLQRFVGVWKGDVREGKGRQKLLVVTDAHSDGQIDGYYVYGPAAAGTWNSSSPAGYTRFSASVSGNAFQFKSGRYPFNISMTGEHDLKMTIINPDDGKSDTITMLPIWQFVPADGQARRASGN